MAFREGHTLVHVFGAPQTVRSDQHAARTLDLRTEGVGLFMASCDSGDQHRVSRFYVADALLKWNDTL